MLENYNNLYTDIRRILGDIMAVDPPNHADEAYVLSCCEYIRQVLGSEFYPTKYLYDEILSQFVYEYFGDRLYDSPYRFSPTPQNQIQLRDRVNYLKEVPQPEQRTSEWYTYREGRITASDAAAIWNQNPFCRREELLEKKSSPIPIPFNGSLDAVNHGVRFEPSVTWMYEKRMGEPVIEFGCLPHDEIPFIGASPDGITNEGIMLEIKCPFQREIYGVPPIYYWIQMQLQLEVADLERCDFVECKIVTHSKEEFVEHLKDNTDTDNKYESGAVIEYYDEELEKLDHIHFPYGSHPSEIDEWQDKILLNLGEQKDYRNTIYWTLERYSQVSIYRDRRWFERSLPDMAEFWKLVIAERELVAKGLPHSEHYPKAKVPRTKSSAPSVCLIQDDSDSDTGEAKATTVNKKKSTPSVKKPPSSAKKTNPSGKNPVSKPAKSVCMIPSSSDSD